MTEPAQAQRLDKWLWAARFFKTRALAVEAVERHRVRLHDQAVKPAREVRVGDRIQVTQPGWIREVEVLGLSMMRGPAPVAQLLYQDTPKSQEAAKVAAEQRRLAPDPASTQQQGRPTKRDRRLLDAMHEPALPEWERWRAEWPVDNAKRRR